MTDAGKLATELFNIIDDELRDEPNNIQFHNFDKVVSELGDTCETKSTVLPSIEGCEGDQRTLGEPLQSHREEGVGSEKPAAGQPEGGTLDRKCDKCDAVNYLSEELATEKCQDEKQVETAPKVTHLAEIVDLFQDLEDNTISRSTSNTSCFSLIADSRSSKIPRKFDTNLKKHSNSKSTTSISSISNDKVKSRLDNKKTLSPRVSARGLELELKASKKKYLDVKSNYDATERDLEKMSIQIKGIIDKISEISGKEKAIDDDLLSIKKFLPIKLEKRDLDSEFFEHVFKESNKNWQGVVEEMFRDRLSITKLLEGKKLDLKPDFYAETANFKKKIENIKNVVDDRQRSFLAQVEALLKYPSEQSNAFKSKIKCYESALKDHRNKMSVLKKSFEEKNIEIEKLEKKYKDLIEKQKLELINKSKDMELLKEENMRVINMNKGLTKTVASLNKQYEESCKSEKQFERKFEEIRDKLANLQQVEKGLKKKICTDCQPEGCEVVRSKLKHEIECVQQKCTELQNKLEVMEREKFDLMENGLSKKAKEQLAILENKLLDVMEKERLKMMEIERLTLLEKQMREEKVVLKRKSAKVDEGQGEAFSCNPSQQLGEQSAQPGVCSEEEAVYRKISRRLRTKVHSLLTSLRESEEEKKRMVHDVQAWEEELRMREDRLYQQMQLQGIRQQFMTMLKERRRRQKSRGRSRARSMSCELLNERLEAKTREVEILQMKMASFRDKSNRSFRQGGRCQQTVDSRLTRSYTQN